MRQQIVEIENKLLVCAGVIRQVTGMQEKYRGIMVQEVELAGRSAEVKRERRELAQRKEAVDAALNEARIRCDSLFSSLTLQDQLESSLRREPINEAACKRPQTEHATIQIANLG
jgi:hypothetical protein